MSHELNSSFVIKTILKQCNCLLSSVATDIVRPTFQVLVINEICFVYELRH